MTQIDPIYQNGIFKPLQAVGLTENQRVKLNIQPVETGDVQAWLDGIQKRRQLDRSRSSYW